jgi:hypothetical protein
MAAANICRCFVPTWARALRIKCTQELGPERLGLRRTDLHAEHLAPAIGVTATAIITATETILPDWRTFT